MSSTRLKTYPPNKSGEALLYVILACASTSSTQLYSQVPCKESNLVCTPLVSAEMTHPARYK
jgi:hypothetical protein